MSTTTSINTHLLPFWQQIIVNASTALSNNSTDANMFIQQPDMYLLAAQHRQNDANTQLVNTQITHTSTTTTTSDLIDPNEYRGEVEYIRTVDIVVKDIAPTSASTSTSWLQSLSPIPLPVKCFVNVDRKRIGITIEEMDDLHGERSFSVNQGDRFVSKVNHIYCKLDDDPNHRIFPSLNQLLASLRSYKCNAWIQIFTELVNPADQLKYIVPISLLRSEQGGPGFQRSSNWTVDTHNQIVLRSALSVPQKGKISLLSN